MKKRRKKTAMKRCDDEWKRQVKQRAGWKCEHCGKTKDEGYQLHSHHLIRRDRRFFRHNLNNGMCLCANCHSLNSTFSAHGTPWAFDEWLKHYDSITWVWFSKNRNKTFPGLKINYDEVLEMLKGQSDADA